MTFHRVALAGLLTLLVVGLWFPPVTPPHRNAVPGGDIVLFRAVVERMRSGEPYYETMRAELQKRGYPTASIFNWRPPLTFMLLARAPSAVHGVMLGLGAIAVALSFFVFRTMPPPLVAAALLLVLGSAGLPFFPLDGLYLPELWAGIFLLLSILAYSLGSIRLGVCCAVIAVCARELALPYVLASVGLAWHARRMYEVRWYAIGMSVFLAYYITHIFVASSHIRAGDMSHTYSWITFGGWPFVVTTVATGGWHLLLPRWTAAVSAVVVLASLAAPADPHLKAMVIAYLAAFSIVGQSFNNSWGLLTGPTWGLASAYGLLGLRHLWRASFPSRNPKTVP